MEIVDFSDAKLIEPEKVIDIVSEKYGVTGQIRDYGMVIKLIFTHEGREHVIGISRPIGKLLDGVGLMIMETTIEKLLNDSQGTFLHYWYISSEGTKAIGHGVVTGHPNLPDTTRTHTSPILSTEIDTELEEAVLTTANTVYRCPLSYCRFKKQADYPAMLPDFDALREKYEDKLQDPEIEQGKVLLVLSDFDDYYFHSLCVKDDKGEKLNYSGWAHVGMFQDSYLIEADDYRIDLRYFPHFGNIEFYETETDGMPLYAENIGSSVIYIRLRGMTFSLKSGERKELTKKNAEEKVKDLPDGDLYPAGTM